MGRKTKVDLQALVSDNPSEVPKVYRIAKFYTFLKETSRSCQIVALYGGAGSGKSESVCQEFVDRLFEEDDISILVVRKSGPSLTASTFDMMLKVLKKYGYVENVDYTLNKTERVIRTKNNIMWFKALDDSEKIKSLNLNYVYIEEATEISYKDFEQLVFRCRNRNKSGKVNQVIMSFNPISPHHWTKTQICDKADIFERSDYKKIVGYFEYEGKQHPLYATITERRTKKPYIAVQHSTRLDNPFVDFGQTMDKKREDDDEMYKIYGLGEFVEISNLIYTRYDVVNTLPSGMPKAFGLDFGWHRTALVAVWHDGKSMELYVKTVMYDENVTTQDIIRKFEEFPSSWRGVKIYADSARPDQIEELQRMGYVVEPAKKDVKAGIDMVKRFFLHIVGENDGLLRELPMYKWREKNGIVLDEPVKKDDHACDGLRYAVFSSEIADYTNFETFAEKTLTDLGDYSPLIPSFEMGMSEVNNTWGDGVLMYDKDIPVMY